MVSDFDVVVAMDLKQGIGKAGQLPWKLSGDMKFFKELTSKVESPGKKNAVVMGRKTWESIPSKRRPLPDRINVVITRDTSFAVPPGVIKATSLDEALSSLEQSLVERCFVIGGGEIYRLAVAHPGCRRLYLTEVKSEFDCDVFFPQFDQSYSLLSPSALQEDNGIEYAFKEYVREQESGIFPEEAE
jgi:dihydrofolate reductase